MGTRIGFDQYSIAHRGVSAVEALEFAHKHGFDGVQFADPCEIDRSLDPETLSAFRRLADAEGLYLEVGLPTPNPVRRTREEGRHVSAAEHADDLLRYVEAVATLGCSHARVYVGDRHDRFRIDTNWKDQVDATREVLDRLTPALRDRRIKVAIETHADFTVNELLTLLDRLDPEIAGVTLDTGNLVMRLDDPVWAVDRLAPWVLGTHVKDCVLENSARGLRWQARPVGSGVLPMPDLLAPLLHANPALNLSIEVHPRTYDLPIFDPSWLAFFPNLKTESVAAVVRLTEVCEARYVSSFLERPDEVEALPWIDRDFDWLALSLGYLRQVVPAISRIDPPSSAGPSPR